MKVQIYRTESTEYSDSDVHITTKRVYTENRVQSTLTIEVQVRSNPKYRHVHTEYTCIQLLDLQKKFVKTYRYGM